MPDLWDALTRTRTVRFEASDANGGGWSGCGEGTVAAECPAADVLVFREAGEWQPERGGSLAFRNVYRWTRTLGGDAVKLEHLRFGEAHPVYLFDLVPAGAEVWESVASHRCDADDYGARLRLNETGFDFRWEIAGPDKRVVIDYWYGR